MEWPVKVKFDALIIKARQDEPAIIAELFIDREYFVEITLIQ